MEDVGNTDWHGSPPPPLQSFELYSNKLQSTILFSLSKILFRSYRYTGYRNHKNDPQLCMNCLSLQTNRFPQIVKKTENDWKVGPLDSSKILEYLIQNGPCIFYVGPPFKFPALIVYLQVEANNGERYRFIYPGLILPFTKGLWPGC